ncbi:hypothetical protein CALVIDRAFT_537220 [Calocera viscosa TUFC12733]|uniref:Uncharacterized protein n=1 Tax=Calocera viscosa (strain TUFC12733) TaxID=1330018 RepID=A0A167M8I3_CALVF|nr:hypothetical protein CALVIDRAFT_537220 [Calocera viscosa TUFC12733]
MYVVSHMQPYRLILTCCQLVQGQRDDIRDLGEKLALINGHVLSLGHLSPNSDVDEPTMKLLQELIKFALFLPVMEGPYSLQVP